MIKRYTKDEVFVYVASSICKQKKRLKMLEISEVKSLTKKLNKGGDISLNVKNICTSLIDEVDKYIEKHFNDIEDENDNCFLQNKKSIVDLLTKIVSLYNKCNDKNDTTKLLQPTDKEILISKTDFNVLQKICDDFVLNKTLKLKKTNKKG